jgi:glyoxylase-like metal-dependent hydrolase (beta-lactamase superfamily II)/rhodanese-related sulfurtransferase
MEIVTVETPSLGNRSYVVVIDDVAAVIDPPRDIDRVEAVLAEHGCSPRVVAETHRHADYVSGGLELARRYDATYAAPAGHPPCCFVHTPVVDGTVLQFGALTLTAIHTPGHTPHHVTYALADETGRALAAFTGGALLPGTVGRTDLIDPALTETLARDQWRSARRLIEELPPTARVLSTHGFGSLCSSAPDAAADSTTLGDEWRVNPALVQPEDEFAAALVASYEGFPPFYRRLPAVNAAGPAPIDLSPPQPIGPHEVRRRVAAGEWVVDLRARRTFAGCHLAGTVNADSSGKVGVYLGWLLPAGADVTLLADDPASVARAQRELSRVGIDRPAAQSVGSPETWASGDSSALGTYPSADLSDLVTAHVHDDVTVLDLRARGERARGAVPGALTIPLHEVDARVEEVRAAGRPEVWVHCATGFRASIAASLLDRAGVPVVLVDDAFDPARWARLRDRASSADAVRRPRSPAPPRRPRDAQPAGADERDGVRRHDPVARGAREPQ